MAKKTNKHHIIPRSREDEILNPHTDQNIIILDRDIHEAYHRVFRNMTPQETLKEWLKMNITVISSQTRSDIIETISTERVLFYSSKVIKKL